MIKEMIKETIDDKMPFYSALSTASSILYMMKDVNWAGFYLLEVDTLYVGPYQGEIACISIPVGKGVCGTSVKLGQTLVVDNVHEFKGHIACSSKSKSEIVVPILSNDTIIGVIDIDSPIYNRFSDSDKEELEEVARYLGGLYQNGKNLFR